MKMVADMDGNRTSIPVEGLEEFHWSPKQNMLIFNSFPEAENQMPRTTFMEIPSRREKLVHTMKDAQKL